MAEYKIDIEKSVQNILDRIYERFGVSAERLVELAEADKEGRCIVAPCAVGDKVYFIGGMYGRTVREAEVEEIYYGETFALGVSTGVTTFTLQESEYFLTREEAEKEIKEREE